jgi:hypothetical protein
MHSGLQSFLVGLWLLLAGASIGLIQIQLVFSFVLVLVVLRQIFRSAFFVTGLSNSSFVQKMWVSSFSIN